MVKRNFERDFTLGRHQQANYRLNLRVLGSENPRNAVRAQDQDFDSDLTEHGKVEARQQARKFFKGFSPKRDAFFFASGNFVRAIETAKIYLDAAKKMGFEIIIPRKTGDLTVSRVGSDEIKHLQNLSLKVNDALIDQLFNPKSNYLEGALGRGVKLDPDLIMRWRKARAIIERDNKGTWSENWRYYSGEAKKIIPEIVTSKEMFDTQFMNLTKLMRIGQEKIKQSGHPKKIRIVAFTHENLFTHWLSEYWNEPGMGLGETVSFHLNHKKHLQAYVRGKQGPALRKQKKTS